MLPPRPALMVAGPELPSLTGHATRVPTVFAGLHWAGAPARPCPSGVRIMAMSNSTPSNPGADSLFEGVLQILGCLGLLIAVDPKIPFVLLEHDAVEARWGVDRVSVLQ